MLRLFLGNTSSIILSKDRSYSIATLEKQLIIISLSICILCDNSYNLL